MNQRYGKGHDDRQRQDPLAAADVAKATDRHPDQIEDRNEHAEALGAEPVEPAQRELALLVARQPARAGEEAPPVLLHDLEAAIGPAMPLLLEGLVGVGQQPAAIAVIGVMREPAMLDDGEPE